MKTSLCLALAFLSCTLVCGNLKNDARISNSIPAVHGQFPWLAALNITHSHGIKFCTGILIAKDFILTSAYCLNRAVQVEVVLGANDITNLAEEGQERLFSRKTFIHENWNEMTLENDIGLVKLDSPVKLNDFIKETIIWYSDDPNWQGYKATMTGWGATSADDHISDVLRYQNATILTHEECSHAYPSLYNSTVHVCLGGKNSINMCTGDEGGPLIYENIYGPFALAIASFRSSSSCLDPVGMNYPSVYTRIWPYKTWINKYTPTS